VKAVTTAFQLIVEEFRDDLDAIKSVVVAFSEPDKAPKARIAAANSATLLLAATFEEFIREMAREYARAVVNQVASVDKLPPKLIATAWKRTMDSLGRVRLDAETARAGSENVFGAAQARFSVIYEFCKGDLTQDIYRDLIHNENNMRGPELNALFKVSGLADVCRKLADRPGILEHFGEAEATKAHAQLLDEIESFFERRNGIAHALNPGQSTGPDQILNDITFLDLFGQALCETLDAGVRPIEPPSPSRSDGGLQSASMNSRI
jgi:hypothetical protein